MLSRKRLQVTLSSALALLLAASTNAFVPAQTRRNNNHDIAKASPLQVSIPLDDYKTSESYNKFKPVVSSVSPGSAEFPKVGILLLNLGGPETLDDVEGKSNQLSNQ